MLQNALKEIKGKLLNKTRLDFSCIEYKKMKEILSFYEETYKDNPLWEVIVDILEKLEVLCLPNTNFFCESGQL